MPAHTNTPQASSARPSSARPSSAQRAAAQVSSGEASQFTHLTVTDLAKEYGDRRVLTDISFTAAPGDRVGLVGENGTGKSTLLRLLAGLEEPDSGTVNMPKSVGLLLQELPYSLETPIGRVLDDAQRESLDVIERIERIGTEFSERPDDPTTEHAYAEALDEAERTQAWSAASRRGDIVSGLGLGGIAEHRPVEELSGGQRLRLALAALLLRAPHTLLLDEPSNHLDDESAAYLERVLMTWPGIVIVASHDRTLLDAVTTRIFDLDPMPVAARELANAELRTDPEISTETAEQRSTDDTGSGFGVRVWGVGYSAARSARQAEMRRWREQYEHEQATVAALAHEIAVGSREVNRKHESKSESRITKKFYADKDAKVTARRARNASVRLDALERGRVRRPPEPLRFHGFVDAVPSPSEALETGTPPTESTHPEPALFAHRVSVAGRLRETSVRLDPHDRVLLTGANGTGKSTLLALLAGELDPDHGVVERRTRVDYLPQEVSFSRPERTASEVYRNAVGVEVAERISLEKTGLLAERDLEKPVKHLSVGQRRRLALATLVADPPPVLLLDEPTNHLSLTLVEELEEALRGFKGALIVASHDRWLRSRWEAQIGGRIERL
ncbi:MAG: ABC-F family ATP-binding cassette domain-containing protein [Leucobacter sp.]